MDRLAMSCEPDQARAILERVVAELSASELAACGYNWRGLWAREKQLIPFDGWRSYGFLTARRVGKTRSIAEWITGEVMAGRAFRIGACAQNWDKGLEVQIEGDAGLIECSPPWFKARWTRDRVVWPNGAQAFLFTPEKPHNFRGPGLHIFWASEVQAWPRFQMEEAFSNAELMTSIGYAKIVWDATPRRRHVLIKALLDRAEAEPEAHRVIRGTIEENRDNLGAGVIEDLRRRLGDTRRGREELGGEFFDDDDGALWLNEWIEAHRRDRPSRFVRRILSIDPAISDRRGTDSTGFIELGLTADRQVHVLGDRTGVYEWDKWGTLAIELYRQQKCDCIVVERNRGGDACAANLRACAKELGLRVEVLKQAAKSRWNESTVYVKEVFSTRAKEARAEPVATMYEKGRVSHCTDADLGALEELMTTWDPGHDTKSPDAIDALVHGVWELAELSNTPIDYAQGFRGIEKISEKLRGGSSRGIMSLLGKSEWGNRL